MTLEELDRWEASFRDFHARFAHLFDRSQARQSHYRARSRSGQRHVFADSS